MTLPGAGTAGPTPPDPRLAGRAGRKRNRAARRMSWRRPGIGISGSRPSSTTSASGSRGSGRADRPGPGRAWRSGCSTCSTISTGWSPRASRQAGDARASGAGAGRPEAPEGTRGRGPRADRSGRPAVRSRRCTRRCPWCRRTGPGGSHGERHLPGRLSLQGSADPARAGAGLLPEGHA